jgi:hypothetical protein
MDRTLGFLTVMVMVLFFAVSAGAQTARPDVPLVSTGGIYPMKCMSPSDTDMASICFVRTDLADGVVELGCSPAGPDQEIAMDLSITITIDDDAEIRCYAVDTDDLVGDYSDNAGLVDFTRPGKPYVIQ